MTLPSQSAGRTKGHTPGPWGLHIGADYIRVLRTPNSHTDDFLAEVYSDGCGVSAKRDAANAESNARLIARAPDLLAENSKLKGQLEEAVQALEGAANVFALMAFKDCADPDMLAGWVKLKDDTRSLLTKLKEAGS